MDVGRRRVLGARRLSVLRRGGRFDGVTLRLDIRRGSGRGVIDGGDLVMGRREGGDDHGDRSLTWMRIGSRGHGAKGSRGETVWRERRLDGDRDRDV